MAVGTACHLMEYMQGLASMTKQTFAFHVTHYYSSENEWMSGQTIKKIKKLWSTSGGDQNHPDHKKARELLKPHINAKFDREYVVQKISDLIATVDEDGWLSPSEESLVYGLRKSIFEEINLDTYEPEKVDYLDLVDLHFYELNEKDEIDTSRVGDGLGMTVLCTVDADVKETIPDIDSLEKWIDKFELDFSRLFQVELGDSLTTYLDEDGDEMSGYSNSTLSEGYMIAPPSMSNQEFREISIAHALGNGQSAAEVAEDSILVLKALSSGKVNELIELLKGRPIDKPLIVGSKDTAPLPLIFSSLVTGTSELEEAINSLDDSIGFSFPSIDVRIEMIYALASLGANLQYRIADAIGYLEVAIMSSDELTDFLLSFGLDALDGGGDALLMACEMGRTDLIQRFLNDGAEVDFENSEGTTALLIAAQGKSDEEPMSAEQVDTYIAIAGLLLEAGASINKIDNGGDSALSNSVRVNCIEMCRFLVEKGSDPNPQLLHANAICPLELAREKGFEEVASFLEGIGGGTARAASRKNRSSKQESLVASTRVPSDFEGKEIDINKASLSDKLPCSGCGKKFTVKTLRKWGGKCHNCYSKSGPLPRNKANKKTPSKQSSTSRKSSTQPSTSSSPLDSIGSFFSGLFELIEVIFDLFKALAVLSVGILFIVAIIAAIFSG